MEFQEYSIPFLNKQIKMFVQKGHPPHKGIIINFGGLPGGPADLNSGCEIIDLSGQKVECESSSTGKELFQSKGYDYLTFDYPGLWKTPNEFTIANAVKAGKEVINFARDKLNGTTIYVYSKTL